MARSRRRRRKGGRSKSRRSTSRLLMIAGIVLALLYFTFTRVFFDPFEESQPGFERLSPRDVDVFLHREKLSSDFVAKEGLPVPRVWDRLTKTAEWRAFEKTATWQELEWARGWEASLSEMEPVLAELPLDPLTHILGEEAVLLGRDVATDGGRWAMLARLSGRGKMAVELFGFESVLQEAVPGGVAETIYDDEIPDVRYTKVSGELLGDPLFYARETDLLVVGQDESLVRDVLRLVHGSSELSVGLSRIYADHMPQASGEARSRFSAAFGLALGDLLKAWDLLPSSEVQREDALANMFLRLVDTSLVRDAVGRLELAPGEASLQVHGEIDVGRARLDTGGLLDMPTFSVHDHLTEVMDGVPQDTSLVFTMNVELKPFLSTAAAAFAPEVLSLVNNTLVEVSQYTAGWQIDTVPELISELARILGDRVTFVVRPIDHEIPEGSQPLPAMAVMLPVSDLDGWTTLEDVFLRAHDVYGVSSDQMKQLDEGVGDRRWLTLTGVSIEEIAYIVLDRETLVIATDNDLLQEMVDVYTGGRRALSAEPEVKAILREFQQVVDARANLAGWVSADGLVQVLEPYGEYLADVGSILDYGVLRAAERKKLVGQRFPDYRGREDELPDDLEQTLAPLLDAYIDGLDAERKADIPRKAQEWRESLRWLELLEQAALGLHLGDRSTDLEVRLHAVGG